MWLIFGLGNPGARYASTRHNVGVRVLEVLAGRIGAALRSRRFDALMGEGRIGGDKVLLLAPQTYMNLSGRSVSLAARYYREVPERIVVVHDDVDLALGRIRVKNGGGHGGHKGLRSIVEHLGSRDFIRVRVGVGRPPEGVDTADHVLSPFEVSERATLEEVLAHAADAVMMVVEEGVSAAMNRYNGLFLGEG